MQRREYRHPVTEAPASTFDVTDGVPLEEAVETAARGLAREYWQDHENELSDIVADSFLEGYDELDAQLSMGETAPSEPAEEE